MATGGGDPAEDFAGKVIDDHVAAAKLLHEVIG
jgi:hypothetical protein